MLKSPQSGRRASRAISLLGVLMLMLASLAWNPGRTAAQDEVGPAGTEVGTLRIISRDLGTDVRLKGACYRIMINQYGTVACDAFDGLDGATMLNIPVGTWNIRTQNPPSMHYYGPGLDNVTVAAGATKTVSVRHQAGGGDVLVKMTDASGHPALDGCVQIFSNNNGTPGTAKSDTVCDYFSGFPSDGVIRLNGISNQPTASALAMPYGPVGYKVLAPKPVLIELGKVKTVTFVATLLALSPYCGAGPTSGRVGTNVKITCRGFAEYQTVQILWDGRSSASIYYNSGPDGRFTTYLKVPAATGGIHKIVIRTNTHRAPDKQFTVLTTIDLSSSSGIGGKSVRATLRGYGKGEVVNIRRQGSSKVLATVTTSSSGSASVLFAVPDGPAADIYIIGEGNAGHYSKALFHRTGAAPTPTATATATATETATAEPSATPTATATTEAPVVDVTVDPGTPESTTESINAPIDAASPVP